MSALKPPEANRSRLGVVLRPFEATSIGPAWIGLALAVSYLLLHCAFDATYLAFADFPPGLAPMWAIDQWWTDWINAVIIGFLPAAQAIARRGVARDLSALRADLRLDDAEFVALCDRAAGPGGLLARGLALSGIVLGARLVFVDSTVSLAASQTANNPVFVWALARTMLMGWVLTRFAVYNFNTTRIYMTLGRTAVKVDLLDIRPLAPIARRGQHSALIWVLFSMVFSLFWLGDAASRSNLPVLVAILSMATFGFAGPLVALRQNIVAEKHKALDALREQIRLARDQPSVPAPSPQLANTVAYYQLIESAREWPIDAANLLKFMGYMLLGLGSWLGGAVVERILDAAIRG